MKITVIGTGYVGLVCGTCLAELGNSVTCIDTDEDKISKLKNGVIPIYEPGLEEMVKRNHTGGRLMFSSDTKKAVNESKIVFIAVGTPASEDGSPNMTYFFNAAKEVANSINDYKIIVNKSTVPVGTAIKLDAMIKDILSKKGSETKFDVVSNPEFLKEGAAIEDFMKPDRIIIGCESEEAALVMQDLYKYFVRNGHPVFIMDTRSSEMTKYASNAFLASRISFINEIANLCENVGADIEHVRKGVGGDSRIGYKFLNPSPGFGGSCFPKDLRALMHIADSEGVPASMLNAIIEVNEYQKKSLVKKIVRRFGSDLTGMVFSVWGLSFKPKTDDMRESPSIVVIRALIELGATVKAFDPAAIEEAKIILGNEYIQYFTDQYEALDGTDALVIITEWNVFRNPDFNNMILKLKNPIIFDGRNIYNPKEVKKLGFEYYSIGRSFEQ
ncbi:MAG: UDP-glucose/GDP-mannose dehydrogenase family protein [Clostridia bacterium]|jgi:UDPglucose 6-dehydrogenase